MQKSNSTSSLIVKDDESERQGNEMFPSLHRIASSFRLFRRECGLMVNEKGNSINDQQYAEIKLRFTQIARDEEIDFDNLSRSYLHYAEDYKIRAASHTRLYHGAVFCSFSCCTGGY